MGIFLKYGDKVKGDVTTTQYKDWIMCHSFQFGVGRAIHSPQASGGNRQGSHASVSEVVLTKILDPSTLGLFTDALVGKLDTKAEVALTLATDANPEYLHVTMWDTGLSGWSTSAGGDRPSESISLNFAKVEYKVYDISQDGKTSTPSQKTYDLRLQKMT